MIKIICVGKIKEKYFKEAIAEYKKRLSKYTKLEIIEVIDFERNSKEEVKKLEGELILKNIKDKDYVITLDIKGNKLSSLSFANKINNILINNSNLAFVIGGSYGLDDTVNKRSNYSLSFSDLTFPHQLFRVILLEQIYRSYKILNNESYHK